MRVLLRLTLIFFFLQLMNCTYAQKGVPAQKGDQKPQWINRPYAFYPQQKYIVGVGSGDTREAAEKNAIAQIAKVFQSNIQVDETLIESVLENSKGHKSELKASSEIYNRTRINSNQQLKNVKIERAYFSESDGLYYVLASMDRAETARLYEQDFNENDHLMAQYFKQAQAENTKLHKLADLNKAFALSEINRLINEQYKVLTSGHSLTPSVPKNELDLALRRAREEISVQLQAQPSTLPEVGDYIKELVGKIGFNISAKNADFILKYQLKISKTSLNRPGIVAFNWQLVVQLQAARVRFC